MSVTDRRPSRVVSILIYWDIQDYGDSGWAYRVKYASGNEDSGGLDRSKAELKDELSELLDICLPTVGWIETKEFMAW